MTKMLSIESDFSIRKPVRYAIAAARPSSAAPVPRPAQRASYLHDRAHEDGAGHESEPDPRERVAGVGHQEVEGREHQTHAGIAQRGDERALLQIRLLVSPDLQIGLSGLLAGQILALLKHALALLPRRYFREDADRGRGG